MSKREKEKEDRGEHYRFSGLGGTNSLLTSFTFSPTSPNFDTLDYFSLCLLCIPWFVWAILLRNVYVSLVFWDTFCERILILSWRGLSTSHNQDLTLDFPATWSSFTFWSDSKLVYFLFLLFFSFFFFFYEAWVKYIFSITKLILKLSLAKNKWCFGLIYFPDSLHWMNKLISE